MSQTYNKVLASAMGLPAKLCIKPILTLHVFALRQGGGRYAGLGKSEATELGGLKGDRIPDLKPKMPIKEVRGKRDRSLHTTKNRKSPERQVCPLMTPS